ncbi:MAG: M48 family metalloprotease [Leptolyngbyaceae cyanobacterium MO_188.B28]|nr:M48 family metalloprotease [Leptolyngbyaceae cyanobacterium MO_188.B28]
MNRKRLSPCLDLIKLRNLLKVKTPEEFDALVQRIETEAALHPGHYRFRLAGLAVLGYAYIFCVFVLLYSLLWGVRKVLLFNQDPYLIARLNWITVLLGLGLLRLFWVRFPPPKGLPLNRKQVPALFSVIDQLTQTLNAPRFNHILLTPDLNAGVLQRPRFGFIGWQVNYLLLGLPLMQALSPDQFRAVAAHELAHLSNNDSWFAGWIYRVRQAWFELAEKFQADRQGGFLFRRFFSWYGPFFKAYSFVLARTQEYEADRRAAEIVGADHKAEALLNLSIHSHFLQKKFWPKIYQQTTDLATPPKGTIPALLQDLETATTAQEAPQWLALDLARQTDNEATHPCLTDRLTALGYEMSADLLLDPINQSAAQTFFGDALTELSERLDQFWGQEEANVWKQQHNQKQQQIKTLARLDTKAQTHPLTVEETWKRGFLTWQLREPKSAIPLFREGLAQAPEHPMMNYHLGQILLDQQESSGVSHLETAMDQDPALVIPGCQLLSTFFRQQSHLDRAEKYRHRWRQQDKPWKLAQQERTPLKASDRFMPHQLPDAEVNQLSEQLAEYPEVKAAYLVQKQVTRFPEKPFYGLAIVRRYYPGEGPNYKTDVELSALIMNQLSFSGELTLMILNRATLNLLQGLRKVGGAMIYQR